MYEYDGNPADDVVEVEMRDKLAVCLLDAAEHAAQAVRIAAEANDGDNAKKLAEAAESLTKAHVLLAPIEAADDLGAQAEQTTQQRYMGQ